MTPDTSINLEHTSEQHRVYREATFATLDGKQVDIGALLVDRKAYRKLGGVEGLFERYLDHAHPKRILRAPACLEVCGRWRAGGVQPTPLISGG